MPCDGVVTAVMVSGFAVLVSAMLPLVLFVALNVPTVLAPFSVWPVTEFVVSVPVVLISPAPLSVIDQVQTTLYPGGILNTGFALKWAKDRAHDAQPASPTSGQPWAYERVKSGDKTRIETVFNEIKFCDACHATFRAPQQ